MCRLGDVCPSLFSLVIDTKDSNPAHLQTFVDLLPSRLPNVSSLALHGITNKFPNLSKCTCICRLILEHTGTKVKVCWQNLPPKLQRLGCASIPVGPPAKFNGQDIPATLTSLHISNSKMHLQALADLLLAAPALQDLRIGCGPTSDHPSKYLIHCSIDQATADAFSVLNQRMNLLQQAIFYIKCSGQRSDMHLDAFPCMAGATTCIFQSSTPAMNLPLLLKVFPDVEDLTIHLEHAADLDDVDLQQLAASARLTRLVLGCCKAVTPMGLLSFCQPLPRLRSVTFVRCPELQNPALIAKCMQLLQSHGKVVKIVEKGPQFLESLLSI